MAFCTFSTEYKKTNSIVIDKNFLTDYLPLAEGIFIKVYFAGLSLCYEQEDVTLDEFAKNIDLTKEEVEDCFVFWESYDLVKILSFEPLTIKYLPVPRLSTKPKKYKVEKYNDFSATLQSMIPDRLISVSEYSSYYSIMEDNKIKPDALLLIIKYCVDLKGNDIGFRYIQKVVNDFISRNLTTFESITEELSSYVLQSSEVGQIVAKLGLKRKAEIEDIKLYEKWTKVFGYTFESILFAIDKLKKGKIEKLDEFICELYSYKLFTKEEIEDFSSKKEYLYDLAIKINKNLSIYCEVLEPVVENYVSVWNSYGYDERGLLMLATYAFKSNKRSLASLDELIKKLYNQGIISFESIIEYFENITKNNDYILKLFEILGISRNPVEWDRNNLEIWRKWGFSDEMIELACKKSLGKANAFSYVNNVLSDWKNKNVFSLSQVTNEIKIENKKFENQREYSEEYFDSLITKVTGTK